VLLELVLLKVSVSCEVAGSSGILIAGEGLGTPSYLAPNATEGSKS